MGLCWDPIRPLMGLGDWLDRVVWKGDVEPAKARSARVAQALKWFRSSKDGVATLKSSYCGQAGPAARAGRRLAQGHAGREREWVSSRPRAANLARERARAPQTAGRGEPERCRAARGVQEHEAPALPLSARGGRAVSGGGPLAPGRRHGAGKDRPGDHLLRHPQADRPHSPRPDHRAGQPEAAVGPRMAGVFRPAGPGRRRLARGTPGRLRQAQGRVPHHQL